MTLFEIMPSLRHAITPRIDRAIWPLTTHVDELGRLCVGEVALTDVADEFGTPTYVIDEADFRHRIRRYGAALPGARLVYAGKALLTTAVAQWVAEEGRGLGVRSRGELATALIAGVDPNQIVVHDMAATPGELCKGANAGVGRIVVDSPTEVAFLAAGVRQPQAVQVSVSSDIDVHEHGHAGDAIQRALEQPLLYLVGLQCHVGSQVTDASLYGEAIRQTVSVMAEVRARHGAILTELNIGGGQGVPYVSGDPELDLDALRDFIDDALDASCAADGFRVQLSLSSPGARSARALVSRSIGSCGCSDNPAGAPSW
jgi:diaminopimelate decarboxylase